MLDASPLSEAAKRPGNPDGDRCRAWLHTLAAARARIVVPEIADFEVRRKLLHLALASSVARLDQVVSVLDYDPLTTPAMRRAAEFWASVRQAGQPTADPKELDCDCVLAAQASLLGGPGDSVTIATANVGHLSRFPRTDARQWDTITP